MNTPTLCKKLFLGVCLIALPPSFLAAQEKVTIAAWGDSRENLDNACEQIADVLLHKKTDWDFQIHNGDFTHHGKPEDWQRTLHFKGIDSLYVRGKFLMCTSNHDAEPAENRPVYDKFTAGVLPTNASDGSTHFYSYQKANVHVFVCDGYFTPPDVMQSWLDSSLALVPDSDWVIGVWHNPAYADISYKEGYLEKCGGWLRSIAQHGRGFILNGHAHLYIRTKPLDPDGRTDDDRGLVHIVNGTGGATWKDPAPPSEKIAYSPSVRSFPCITFLTFQGRQVSIETIDARPDSKLKVIDRWSWSKQ